MDCLCCGGLASIGKSHSFFARCLSGDAPEMKSMVGYAQPIKTRSTKLRAGRRSARRLLTRPNSDRPQLVVRNQAALPGRLREDKHPRKSLGDWPNTRLKVRLNCVSDWNPTSYA